MNATKRTTVRGMPNTRPVLPNPSETPTVTVQEAGHLLGISRASAYEAAARGEIPTIRIGRRILIPSAPLLAMLGAGPRFEDVIDERPPKRAPGHVSMATTLTRGSDRGNSGGSGPTPAAGA